MISDFDEEICIFHCPESLGDELWGCRVAMAQFLRGGGETFDLVKLTTLRQGTILTRPHLFYYLIKLFKIYTT